MLTDRFAQMIGKVATQFLTHKCSILHYVESDILDENSSPIYDIDGEDNVPCLFLWQERTYTDARGTVTENVPIIYLDKNQVIQHGDIIKDVYELDGVTKLLRAAKVNTIDTTAEGGGRSLKVCELEGASI